MNINLTAVDYIKSKALDTMKLSLNDTFIGVRLFDEIYQAFQLPSYDFIPFLTELKSLNYDHSFDFINALHTYDNIVAAGSDYPNWGFETYDTVRIDVPDLEKKADWAFIHLFRSDSFGESLFLFQFLASAFLGGIENDETYQYLDHSPIISAYEAFSPKAVAYILEKEYNGVAIKGIPANIMVNPIDTTHIPAYLLEGNSNIITKQDKVYLKIDIARAISAAGGFAQALERQDLEGKHGKYNIKKPRRRHNDNNERVDGKVKD